MRASLSMMRTYLIPLLREKKAFVMLYQPKKMLAGRMWPAGRTLPRPGLLSKFFNCMLYVSFYMLFALQGGMNSHHCGGTLLFIISITHSVVSTASKDSRASKFSVGIKMLLKIITGIELLTALFKQLRGPP